MVEFLLTLSATFCSGAIQTGTSMPARRPIHCFCIDISCQYSSLSTSSSGPEATTLDDAKVKVDTGQLLGYVQNIVGRTSDDVGQSQDISTEGSK
jgi:hypothetical protein